jgi:hypothetical protein
MKQVRSLPGGFEECESISELLPVGVGGGRREEVDLLKSPPEYCAEIGPFCL